MFVCSWEELSREGKTKDAKEGRLIRVVLFLRPRGNGIQYTNELACPYFGILQFIDSDRERAQSQIQEHAGILSIIQYAQ